MHEGHSHDSNKLRWVAIGCVVLLVLSLAALGSCLYFVPKMFDERLGLLGERLTNAATSEVHKKDLPEKLRQVLAMQPELKSKVMLVAYCEVRLEDGKLTEEEGKLLLELFDEMIANNGAIVNPKKYDPK